MKATNVAGARVSTNAVASGPRERVVVEGLDELEIELEDEDLERVDDEECERPSRKPTQPRLALAEIMACKLSFESKRATRRVALDTVARAAEERERRRSTR